MNRMYTVENVSLLKGLCKVSIDGKEKSLKEYKVSDLKVLKRAYGSDEQNSENDYNYLLTFC